MSSRLMATLAEPLQLELRSTALRNFGLEHRRSGASWVKCAEACTSDGLLEPSLVRGWVRRFGQAAGQPAAPFSHASAPAMLLEPAGYRRPEPQQEDTWERGPPTQP